MDVFLVRHAIAHERDSKRWPDDSKRYLTIPGRRKFRAAARGLKHWLPKKVRVLTSPFVRARETAAILVKVADLAPAFECAELQAGSPTRKVFELLRSRKEKAVVLVGHEPDLGTLFSTALAGERFRLGIEFKKGGAALLRFDGEIRPGRGTLLWMLPPRGLRALKRRS